MGARLASVLAGLFLATATAGAAAQSPDRAATAPPTVNAPAAGHSTRAPQAASEQLQQAVSAAEARRQEVQRRLGEQDREIQALRRQLQGTGQHESTQSH